MALSEADLHIQIRSQAPRRLILFTLDTSDSMGDGPTARISAALGAIVSLAARAYLNRDHVCLISFRDRSAQVVVPPTNSVMRIRQQVDCLPVGGATPLAAGLYKARQVIQQEKTKNRFISPLLVLISDGAASMPMQSGGDPVSEALAAAGQLRNDKVASLVIDTVAGRQQQGLMSSLAEILGTRSHQIHHLQAEKVVQLIEESGST